MFKERSELSLPKLYHGGFERLVLGDQEDVADGHFIANLSFDSAQCWKTRR